MDEKNFDRGTSLSIFVSDRTEDVGALLVAFLIAVGVVLFVGN